MAHFKTKIMLKTELPDNDEKIIIDKIIKLANKIQLNTTYKNYVLYVSGTGSPDDFSHIAIIITNLRQQEWFVNNIKTWLLYDPDGNIEDIKEHYKL